MASDNEDWEDGEILEDGEELEDPATVPPPIAMSLPSKPILSAPPLPPQPQPQRSTHAANGTAPLFQPPLPPTPPPDEDVLGSAPSVPTTSYDVHPRKRLHSTMQAQHAPPHHHAAHRAGATGGRGPYPPSAALAPPPQQPPLPPRREFEPYTPDLIVKYPRQVPASNVLLDFEHWMAHARSRLRLTVDDVQQLLANVALGTSNTTTNEDDTDDEESIQRPPRLSPFFMDPLCPNKPAPTRVCVVLLGNVHPSVLMRYRSTLRFFDACTSVPCVLSKPDDARRVETPLPELLYKFPRPPVSTKGLSAEELFYGHELTFVMRHSFGFTDELTVLPTGSFCRKSQPLGGTWELDGDLLHLQWRQQVKTASVGPASTDDTSGTTPAVDNDDSDAFTLDVLVSEDATMHYFNTDPLVDATYARVAPEHLGVNRKRDDGTTRSIRLGLVKAIAADVARHADGSVVVPRRSGHGCSATQQSKTTSGSDEQQQQQLDVVMDGEMSVDRDATVEASADADDTAVDDSLLTTPVAIATSDDNTTTFGIDYYVLTDHELVLHGFPIDVDDEQKLLELATNNNTRDTFVQTQPRSPVEMATDSGSTTTKHHSVNKPNPAEPDMYGIDCEMCETDLGMELTRVTVVDRAGAVVYDQLVKPQSTILNYLTPYSGITPEMLETETCTVADVQRILVTKFLFADTVLVGHSLTSDLRALRLVHLRVADSAVLYPHARGFPFRTSLKYLTKTYLRRDIQLTSQCGHDSAEDASAAMALVQLKVTHGPLFGLPATELPVGAFDSFAHKVAGANKQMALLRLQCRSSSTSDSDSISDSKLATADAYSKPWQLFASGDLSARARSPFVHAQTFAKQREPDATSSSAVTRVEEVNDWAALKQRVAASLLGRDTVDDDVNTANDDVNAPNDMCWIEIDGPSDHTVYHNFLHRHDAWMASQRLHCDAVDAFLSDLITTVLPPQTLLVAMPQSDLTMLRYLKGLRTRAKWRDAAPNAQWTDDMQAAATDAFRGTMDSVVFLAQK